MHFRIPLFLGLALAVGVAQTAAAGPAVEQLQALVDGPRQNASEAEWREAWQEASQEAFLSLFTDAADWLVDSSVSDDGTVQVQIEVYSPDYWSDPRQSLFLSAQIGGDPAAHAARHSAVLEPAELGWFWVRQDAIGEQTIAINNLAEEEIDSVAWQRAGAVFEVRHASDVRGFAQSVMQRIDSSGLSGIFEPQEPAIAAAPAVPEATPAPRATASADTAATPSQPAEDHDSITLDATPMVVRVDERGPIHDVPLAGEPYPQSGDLVQLPGTDIQGWVEVVSLSSVAVRLPEDADTSGPDLVIHPQRPRSRAQFGLDEVLLEAAASGSQSAVRAALADGANIAALNSGRSALHLAIENKDTALVRTLLEQGAPPDQEGLYGATPLKLAAEHGLVAAVDALIDAGAQVDQVPAHASADEDIANEIFGATALMISVMHQQEAALVRLLAAGADPTLTDSFGITALHFAQQRSVAKLLLDAGADPNAKAGGVGDITPLHTFTGQYNDLSLGTLLLSRGADPEARVTDLPRTEDLKNASALLLAADANDLGAVELLLAIGADPNAKTAAGVSLWDLLPDQYSDLAEAAAERDGQHWWLEAEFSAQAQSRLFRELLDEDPDFSTEVLDEFRQLGLQPHFRHAALADILSDPISEGRRDLVAAALDLGFNPRTIGVGFFGEQSAFELSVAACNTDLIDLLLGYRADPSQLTPDGQTIFALAAERCGDDLGDKLESIGTRQQQARDHYLDGYLAFEDGDYTAARISLSDPQAALQPKAKSLLAVMALDGLGAHPDPQEALALLNQAALVNEPLAIRLLGAMRQRGLAGDRDYAAAETAYRRLAGQSPTWGAMSLAMLWADPHHPDPAAAEFRKADALAMARDAYRSAPARTGLLFGYGYVRAALADPVRGLSDMRTALALWGEQANAAHHLALGDAYHRVGLLQEARESWQAALGRAASPWEQNYLDGRLAEVQP